MADPKHIVLALSNLTGEFPQRNFSSSARTSRKSIKKVNYTFLEIDRIVSLVRKLSKTHKRQFSLFIWQNDRWVVNQATIPYLAKKVRCHPITIMRGNKKLESSLFMKVTREKEKDSNGYNTKKNKPNVYKLRSIFKNPRLRLKLKKILSIGGGLAFSFMFSSSIRSLQNQFSFKNVTHTNLNSNYKYIKDSKRRGFGVYRHESQSPLTQEKQYLIDFMNPTPRSRIEIEKWSKKTIHDATKYFAWRYHKGFRPDEPFLILFKLCVEHARTNGEPVDDAYVFQLKEVYKPTGLWSLAPVDLSKLEKDRKPKGFIKGASPKETRPKEKQRKNAEEKPPIPSVEKMKQDMLAKPAWKLPKIDKIQESEKALSELKNADGSFKNEFAAILERSKC